MQELEKKTCPSQRGIKDALEVINGKWKIVIISALLERKMRFKELAREIGISPRVLSKELQELEINNLVNRTVMDTRPITVEYAVTDYSRSLQEVVFALNSWGVNHRHQIFGRKDE